jgi:hypothetical protein
MIHKFNIMPATNMFSAMLADVVTMSCISLSSNIRLTNDYLAFCC